MWLEQHPYLFFYLLGCGCVIVLLAFKTILFWFFAWITKENILNKNLKKLLPPDERALWHKTLIFIGGLLIDVLLSWIIVAVIAWQILMLFLKTVRALLASTPEAIKLLRFPLWNNPDMSREAVWAYANALKVKAGEMPPEESELLFSLNELSRSYRYFDRIAALNQLEGLNVINGDVISATMKNLSSSDF